jgi:hypothetical protein
MAGPLNREDAEQLKLLSLGHYIVAGLQALFGLFPVLHLAMGIWMLRSPEVTKAKDGPPAALFAGFFIAFALVWILTSWALAACLVIAGRSLSQRRRRTFCLVVAGVAALMCMPFGTVLGVFTIIVLLRPSVRDAFEGAITSVPVEGQDAG